MNERQRCVRDMASLLASLESPEGLFGQTFIPKKVSKGRRGADEGAQSSEVCDECCICLGIPIEVKRRCDSDRLEWAFALLNAL
jgi:hypothetical protein